MPHVVYWTMVSAAALLAAGRTGFPAVAGTYDTQVSLLKSNCHMEVASNPTEVAQYSDSTTITLRHAGTTYKGALAEDGSFRTDPKELDFNGTRYVITMGGRFADKGLSAEVTLKYGDPLCTVIVKWEGPRRG